MSNWFGRWAGRWFGRWYGSVGRVYLRADAIKALRWILANDADLLAVVPANRIMAGVLTLEIVLPAISIMEVSMFERWTAPLRSRGVLCTSRVRVTVFSWEYLEMKQVLELVRRALHNQRGTLNGVDVDSIRADLDGPDILDDDIGLCMQTKDFIVRFNQYVGV